MYELKDQILEIFCRDFLTIVYFFVMQVFSISPKAKSYNSESSSYLAA